MTPQMIDRAKADAEKIQQSNVDFRLGDIEQLPVANASIDVIAWPYRTSSRLAIADLKRMLAAAGFEHVRIDVQGHTRSVIDDWSPNTAAADVVASALIEAVKPAREIAAEPCCDTVLLSACCPREKKPACCGNPRHGRSCACQATESFKR